MDDKLFAQRRDKWQAEGEMTAFNLACVAEGLLRRQSVFNKS